MFFGGSTRKRETVEDARGFCAWASEAAAGDRCTYHIGNLVSDRVAYPELHMLAETILLLQEGGFVIGGQQRIRLVTVQGYAYSVTRTGGGKAPRSVLSGVLTATQYRALEAIRGRASAVSITRAVRDALSISEASAQQIVEALRKRGWVAEQPVKGWELSQSGSKLLG